MRPVWMNSTCITAVARLRRSRFAFNQHGGFRFIGAAGSDRAPS